MPEEQVTLQINLQINDPRNLRYRVNVSTSVKGVKTWDCTVDGGGWTQDAILERSDALVAALEQRYPASPESSSDKK